MKVKIATAINRTKEAISAAQQLDRSREASIVITQLETGMLWLEKIERELAESAE